MNALETMAQALLCFSDPQLLQILAETPPQKASSSSPIFAEDGGLHPQTVLSVSVVWMALLSARTNPELSAIMPILSQGLQCGPQWTRTSSRPAKAQSFTDPSRCVCYGNLTQGSSVFIRVFFSIGVEKTLGRARERERERVRELQPQKNHFPEKTPQ